MDTTSHWRNTSSLPRFKSLTGDVKVDVLIIGAGITGVTAAYLMKRAGYKVALIERGRCGGFDTSNTTAHLTCVTDTRLNELVKRFGPDTAKAVWDSGYAAIDQIHKLIGEEDIPCDFRWVPGFQCDALKRKDRVSEESFRQDAQVARELGFSAHYMDAVPVTGRWGVKYSHQAIFHPLKYLAALLRRIPGKGSYVFEKTESGELKPRTLELAKGKIHYSYLVLATHTPLMGKTNLASATLFQSKLFLYTSYAIGARIKSGIAPEASYWDVSNPYYYLRVERRRGFDYAILGGEDHKTGQLENTEGAYDRLETVLQKLIPSAKVDARWSGQVLETPDGLPFIGETAEKQFAATGFSGNGMTFGTLGAMMALDALEKRKNPWQDLYAMHRKDVTKGAWHYLKENADYPYYMVRNWLAGVEGENVAGLRRNEGKILKLDGKKVAAYRDSLGKITLCSPVCTHLGCIVNWNNAERTWDCPCHGSRFAPTGEVLTGPAEAPLEKVKMADGKIVADKKNTP